MSDEIESGELESDDHEEGSHPHPESGSRRSLAEEMRTSEDWWAIWVGTFLLIILFLFAWTAPRETKTDVESGNQTVVIDSPLKPWIAKPATWESNVIDTFYSEGSGGKKAVNTVTGTIGVFLTIAILFAIAVKVRGHCAKQFLRAFPAVFLLATVAYVMSAHSVVKAYNLEYALWALAVGLIISNTIGTPNWLRPAVLTEFYIKTGLVMLGAEVLMGRLLALGVPGVFVAWIVTPIVLISTYVFGQKVLKMESKSLNMVISADMSVCGVSAAIATAASCKAKKEELSLAIGLSLSFTVVMMVVLPIVIKALGMSETLGGAWMGGTIDSTGAVAAAGATLGEVGEEVASTVKMIQNILIGVTSFCVAVYWVTTVEKGEGNARPSVMEIWYRFPKFVLGFVAASVIFSILHATITDGSEVMAAMKAGGKTFRGWFFCLAFVSIGLQTNFRELFPYFKGGKPLWLYLAGQSLNLILTLAMAWLMFEVVFKETVTP